MAGRWRRLLRRALRLLFGLDLFQLPQQLVGAGQAEQLRVVAGAQLGDAARGLPDGMFGTRQVLHGLHQAVHAFRGPFVLASGDPSRRRQSVSFVFAPTGELGCDERLR